MPNHPQFDLQVYVGCALTHAPGVFKEKVETFKKNLREICHVLCFIVDDEENPYTIYYHDIHECVMNSDLMVAITDLPSTGLGYEMSTQVEKRGMPLLAVAHTKALVSGLILDPRQPGYRFERYKELSDVLPIVQEVLSGIWEKKSNSPLFEKREVVV